jgi:hypothetical protein
MWLEAILTQEDFVAAMGRWLPVKIYLHDAGERPDRWLLLHPATSVALAPGEGLRVTCSAELAWTIAGLSPTMKIDELRVLLRPEVIEKDDRHVLAFDIEVEEADFHSLPGFIDASIVKAVNAALSGKRPTWSFTETLTRTVGLGQTFDPVTALQIDASGGKVRVTAEALSFVVSFKLDFVRHT